MLYLNPQFRSFEKKDIALAIGAVCGHNPGYTPRGSVIAKIALAVGRNRPARAKLDRFVESQIRGFEALQGIPEEQLLMYANIVITLFELRERARRRRRNAYDGAFHRPAPTRIMHPTA